MKRSFVKKQEKQEEISDSSDDSDYDVLVPEGKRQKLSFDKHKAKYDEINTEILKREITISNVLELNLPMDDNIWFVEHFRILANFDSGTEDYLKMKNLIYQKYVTLRDVDHKQLQKIKHDSGVEHDIVTRILSSSHPDSVKAILYRKYKRCYDNTSSNGTSDELFKVVDQIDNILDLPTKVKQETSSSIDSKLSRLWKALGDNIYGLQHLKEKVMETMCAKLLDPENRGKILTFVGPPGVGKTAVSTSIAESLGMPFDQISFGSIKDSTVLTGHSSTYIGAIPGLFTKILLKSKRLDTVVLLDEIDKIPDTPEGRSISSVLLHILDKTQNHRFRDMYMPEIALDLSKMIFLSAANKVTDIDPVLLDRMDIIEIVGYSVQEKVDISRNFLFPRIRKELGFSELELTITDAEFKYLIEEKTTMDPGIRDVERKIYKLCERLSLLKHARGITFSYKLKNIKFPYKIDTDTIKKLL